jgi:hypothetical protein
METGYSSSKGIIKMENHTELEKKLFEYILFQIGIINVQGKTIQFIGEHFSNVYKWMNENFEAWGAKDYQLEMNEFLNKEFDWNLHADLTGEEMTRKESEQI